MPIDTDQKKGTAITRPDWFFYITFQYVSSCATAQMAECHATHPVLAFLFLKIPIHVHFDQPAVDGQQLLEDGSVA